jgi:NAD(P)H-hydrate repair Nnr-like enzyme with NAD(P)H-hydrate dehydratase domain
MLDPGESAELMRALLPGLSTPLIVDALALAAVTDDVGCLHHLGGRGVLTPNPSELATTLRHDGDELDTEQTAQAATQLAADAKVTVSVGGEVSWVAAPDGRLWRDQSGGAGLGVSGSGDVRAGIVAGLVARGATCEQAAVWAAHLHGRAGERLASTIGRLGFLARELPPQIPAVLAEIEQ